MRDSKGRFLPGSSANPGGRPKDIHNICGLARELAPEAIATLAQLMRDGNEKVRLQAAISLLDRGLGKPPVFVASEERNDLVKALEAISTSTIMPAWGVAGVDPPSVQDTSDQLSGTSDG